MNERFIKVNKYYILDKRNNTYLSLEQACQLLNEYDEKIDWVMIKMKGNDNTRYTVKSLIEELKGFPMDTPIETELAMVYQYDSDKVLEECSGKHYDTMEDVFDIYKKYATKLAIFEGSWEDDNISDLNNILPEYIVGWNVEDKCGPNAILKKDIISMYFQIKQFSKMNKGLFLFMKNLGLMDSIDEITQKIYAQKKYAEENNLPFFAPEDGLCICGKQIYNEISFEKAENELITHCPYCSMAYND